jgi:hypothetical protein|tara:strand:+ start:212 stop:994 length:783 start_codon:yes stop_codon:yes gene_type:complete
MKPLINKQGKNIQYNPKAFGKRYMVDGEPKSSVTTVIGNHQNKNGLLFWKRKMVLDGLKNVLISQKKPIDEINKLIKKVELSTNELEEYARDIGTNLHEWIDLYVKGKKPAIPNSEPLKTMVNKWLKWWKASKLEIVESELPLYSSKYDLAGTLDLIVTQKSWKGKLALLDTKTSKDFYVDQAIQIETYRRFLEETTDFKITYLGIVNVPKEPSKQVSMMKLKIDDAYFRGFKASKYLEGLESKFNDKVKKWKKENKRDV